MDASHQIDGWIGRTIGDRQRYRLTKRLGGGGMGEVFLAIDTAIGQEVALKLLKEKLWGEDDLRRRFEREVRLCAALTNDNIVQVKDYGMTEEGNPFYVMEYLRGQTLSQLLRQEKQLSVGRTVGIMNQVCAGLKAAHQGVMLWQDGVQSSEPIQIVHRDLKPENIFLVPTTLGELVKILDFGIAKISSTATEATNTGIFMGTFQYAAPEQLEARKNLDKRADIYSLGMILYEMLSGVDPFTGVGEPLSGMSWVRAHISQSPLPLRSQPSCKQLSPALEAVVMRCLEKEPSDRYNSVDELRIALQNAVGHMFDGPTIVSPSPHIPVEPAILPTQKRPQVETSDRQNLAPASVAPPSVGIKLSKDIQQKLETALANQIGPIATVVLKREVSQSTNYPDLLTRLVQHLPVAQRDEFLTFANTLMGSVHPTMKTAITQMQQAGSGQIAKGTAQVVDPEFAKRCEQELAELIGPMARLIVQRHLKSQLSVQQFVEAIAQQIPDSQQAAKFRQRLLT